MEKNFRLALPRFFYSTVTSNKVLLFLSCARFFYAYKLECVKKLTLLSLKTAFIAIVMIYRKISVTGIEISSGQNKGVERAEKLASRVFE